MPDAILGIESSCDETAAAVVVGGRRVLASVIASQVAAHAAYGGVVPELAAREHLRAIAPTVQAALAKSGLTLAELTGIAVTRAPGLVPALLVGYSFAQGLAAATGLPCMGINHFLAHLYGAFLDLPEELLAHPETYPILALVVSGGHTALLLVAADGTARIIGHSLDDAAGEAFDKAAKILQLGYPGGPIIDRLARDGNPAAFAFPRGLMARPGHRQEPANRFHFSFSGLKTALLYQVRDHPPTPDELCDLAASYQAAIVEVLTLKTLDAAKACDARTVVACGGVACNGGLRTGLTTAAGNAGIRLVIAQPKYCTDNAAMVAGLGWHYLRQPGADRLAPGGVAARLEAALAPLPFAPAFTCRGPVRATA